VRDALYLLLAIAVSVSSAGAGRALQANSSPPLRIAAAADLEPVLPALLATFERQTGNHAVASFASSATLAIQIENGAPFDVFLSADMALPQRIAKEGLAADSSPAVPYARGTLVLWTRRNDGTPFAMQQLASPQVRSIAIGNPEHAPYGRAAIEALTSFGLLPAVESKLRTAENIAQAAQFVSTGNADAGLISLTSALTLNPPGRYVPVPPNSYTPILQGAVVLRRGSNAQAGAMFLNFLQTPAAQGQLRKGGLEPVR
jgi:molybdate transport system substrate-binding protein